MNETILSLIQPVVTDDLIRIGRKTDGGYLVNSKALIDADLVSFGINDDWSFEEHFHSLFKGNIEMFDGSVSVEKFRRDASNIFLSFFSLAFIYSCFRLPGYFNRIIKKYRESTTLFKNFKSFTTLDKVTFHSKFVSDFDGAEFESIEKILEKNMGSKKVFLKIDIEGNEYRILKSVSLHAGNITGMAIEFHDIIYDYEKFSSCITDLLKNFYISHIHANNYSLRNKMDFPEVWEITFINKNQFSVLPDKCKGEYPIAEIDFPNTSDRKDFSFTYS